MFTRAVRLPGRCCVCLAAAPAKTWLLKGGKSKQIDAATIRTVTGSVEVPICADCEVRLRHNNKVSRIIGFLGLIVSVVAIGAIVVLWKTISPDPSGYKDPTGDFIFGAIAGAIAYGALIYLVADRPLVRRFVCPGNIDLNGDVYFYNPEYNKLRLTSGME